MTTSDRIALARYHNGRGVRMMKCAAGVGVCRQKTAFIQLATSCFEARDFQMQEARRERA